MTTEIIRVDVNLIEAIRAIRRVTNIGLKEAKDIAEELLGSPTIASIVVTTKCNLGEWHESARSIRDMAKDFD